MRKSVMSYFKVCDAINCPYYKEKKVVKKDTAKKKAAILLYRIK